MNKTQVRILYYGIPILTIIVLMPPIYFLSPDETHRISNTQLAPITNLAASDDPCRVDFPVLGKEIAVLALGASVLYTFQTRKGK